MGRIDLDNLPHLVDCVARVVCRIVFQRICRVTALWWGVQLGRNCVFLGAIRFRRLPRSRISIGEGCQFNSRPTSNLILLRQACMISTLAKDAEIVIGNKCGFSGTVIACEKKIRIGNHVRCGANTLIMDTDWHTDDPRAGDAAAVNIEDDVWLGTNVVVLKGTSIGKGTVVGANSVVTKSLPKNVVAGGHPATVIRYL